MNTFGEPLVNLGELLKLGDVERFQQQRLRRVPVFWVQLLKGQELSLVVGRQFAHPSHIPQRDSSLENTAATCCKHESFT